jgi:Protein of unknown function (DUF3768)
MDTEATDKTRRIRELNDAFRKSFCGGRVTVTAGVHALPAETKAQLLEMVRTFDRFDDGNDPHGEHDFCSFEIEGVSYLAKVDYYDLELRFGWEDPSNPTKTTRVLTIMRADEY